MTLLTDWPAYQLTHSLQNTKTNAVCIRLSSCAIAGVIMQYNEGHSLKKKTTNDSRQKQNVTWEGWMMRFKCMIHIETLKHIVKMTSPKRTNG